MIWTTKHRMFATSAGLWKIGESFRVMKTDLEASPVLFERMSVSTATSSYAYSPFALSAMRNTSYIRIRV